MTFAEKGILPIRIEIDSWVCMIGKPKKIFFMTHEEATFIYMIIWKRPPNFGILTIKAPRERDSMRREF